MGDNKVRQVVFVNPPFAPKRELDKFVYGKKSRKEDGHVKN